MKKSIIILFAFSIVSCKQAVKETNSIKESDKQYFFGFEHEPVVDTSLFIPDSSRIYNQELGKNLLWRFYISDSSTCFIDKDNISIRAFPNVEYEQCNYYLIKINNYDFGSEYRRCPTAPMCGTGKPIVTLVGRRLILNKSKYEINDTIKGKLFLKYYADYEYARDSSERFKIKVDSILFKYRLYQGSINSINQFEKDYTKK